VITFKVTGLEELKKKIKDLGDRKLKTELNAILKDGANHFVGLAHKDAPVDQSTLKQGITYFRKGDLLYRVASNANYSTFIEFGTKSRYKPIPGVKPGEYTRGSSGNGFYDAILAWVKRKGIGGSYNVSTRRREGRKVDQQIEDEQIAFAIYLSIIRHGVKPHPYFFKQTAPTKQFLEGKIQLMLKAL
jgi:HK97 gp10 family phage protein